MRNVVMCSRSTGPTLTDRSRTSVPPRRGTSHTLTVCVAGFLAKTSQAPDSVRDLTGNAPASGANSVRIIEETSPKIVIVENVASGARRWLPHVRRDLHVLGFWTCAVTLSAFDCGAPHLRRRVFVIAAHPERVNLRVQQQWQSARRAHGVRDQGQALTQHDGTEGLAPHAHGQGPLQQEGREPLKWRWARHGDRWAIESPICGVAHGVPNRLDQLKQLGNAVVPACAEAVGKMALEFLGLADL